ncbi:flagellar hook-associated protein FlgK [Parasulfitobacter algicola]|uniref:Flagellar hook-associated protein 1 n=1 Tax=Parasulfitobacter algicola TaxID=2614809 RepID=A0ABX2IZ93_9RHOB|nr:flagellar hook-associated protein FlgK [Sulfitobacter algicola]NSX56695.1 flagellar hook-associated protein FlgK [Sulfitobacter algicola]
MSITSALSNAVSGLNATSRAAEIVSSNVANAMTEGYGKREISLSSRTTGNMGGVQVNAEQRMVDKGLISDRRLSQAELGYSATQADFLNGLEKTIGVPGEPGSLTDTYARFEASLLAASSQPDSNARLSNVFEAADDVVNSLNGLNDAVQLARVEADAAISKDVDRLNTTLQQVADLNSQIQRHTISGLPTSALLDERQKAVDSIAEIVPIKELPRDNNQVALITTGGAQLVDGVAAQIEFSPTPTIVAGMTVEAGSVGRLVLNGREIDGLSGSLRGGSLAANFSIRDDLAVTAQNQVDALAQDLIERFQDPNVDPTIGAAGLGLFTDRSVSFDPMNTDGIAERITVNAAVDPSQGGDITRLRDGVGATTAGPSGDGTQLISYHDALIASRSSSSSALTTSSRSASGFVSEMLSSISTQRQYTEADQSFAASRTNSLRDLEIASGVNTDEEMQKLLLIEQNYAANARVIQTIDELMQQLIRL